MSLLLVLVVAKVGMLWGHGVPVTLWSALAFTWQDAAVALAFAACAFGTRKIGASPRIAWATYWGVALYATINIPVARVVSTPLTWQMLRATRGPLADSILLYVTATNVLLIIAVLAVAAAAPRLLGHVPAAYALPIVLLGPIAARHVDTHGMDRNAVTALIPTALPRAGLADWRESRFAGYAEHLARFRGAARGLNIVMISLESTAAQYLSLYGGADDPMPNLSRLAQHALVFQDAYAVYPESIKGLFSVLCSTFPAFDSRPEAYEKVPCRSVSAALADAGYRTAMFHSGRFGYLGMESIIRNRGYQVLEDAADIGDNHHSSFGVDEPATVARMLNWIDHLPRGQRFFLTYLPIAGHHPYATPEQGPFRGTADIDQYRNALHYGDVSLGALMDGLRARGLADDTVWMIYGDHGEAFQQHTGNYGHTFFLYEENVHVPVLIAGPAVVRRQERVRKVVSLVDIAPTVLDLVGITAPSGYQGRSMFDGTQHPALFFADYSLGILGLRDGPWKYMYEIESGRSKLFDLDRDPGERRDVSAREGELVRWYGQAVRGWGWAQRDYIAAATTH
jgi:hypothetical protein